MVLTIVTDEVYELHPNQGRSKALLQLLEPLATMYHNTQLSNTGFDAGNITLLKQHSNALVNAVAFLEDDDGIIPEPIAVNLIDAFKSRFGYSWKFTAEKAIVDNFIAYVKKLAIPVGYPQSKVISLRFYMGSNEKKPISGHPHNLLVIPVYNQYLNPPYLTDTYEKDWLMNPAYQNSFAALLGIGQGENGVVTQSTSVSDCGQSIYIKHSELMHTVVFALGAFVKFIANAPVNYNNLTIEFGLNSNGNITVILRCRDGQTILESETDGVTGKSFDEGSLIPPPPIHDSCF